MPRPPVALAIVVTLLVAAACGSAGGDREQPGSATGGPENQGGSSPSVTGPADPATATATAPAGETPSAGAGNAAAGVPRSSGEDHPGAAAGGESRDVEAKSPGDSTVLVPTQAPAPTPAEGNSVGGEVGDKAPEFQAVANWINSEPLSMGALRGKVVLIDFWTYTCVNCIRTFPFLKEWYAKYADQGLVIVGVHSPEFEFEKLTENVVRSVRAAELAWPIAQDNDMGTWRAYDNRFWPAKYLVDQQGTVRYTHFGEGGYGETEEQIRSLLAEAGADLSGVDASTSPEPQADRRAFTSDPTERITREIYGGFERNASPRGVYVAHVEYYDGPDRSVFYDDPGDHLNQFIYLQGLWVNGAEKLRHARETQDFEDYIALRFFATSVNAVIDPEGGDPFEVQVTIDGRPLLPEEAGPDVTVADGRSFFRVDEARMYEVVALPGFSGHEMKLRSNSHDFAFFAFTFGAYAEGP